MAKDPTSEFASPSATAVAGGEPAPAAIPSPGRQFFGRPVGLMTLFFTELWERLSYYGMRALLVLYMTAATPAAGLGFDAERAGVAEQFEKLPLPQLFGAVLATTAGAGLILALLARYIRKLMNGVH